MKLLQALVLALSVFSVAFAQKDGDSVYISAETKKSTIKPAGSGEEFSKNLIAEFEKAEQPQGYCFSDSFSFPTSNKKLCGSGSDIVWKFTFKFGDKKGGDLDMQFGVDFGRGSAIVIDGQFYQARTDDMWWAGNWNSAAVIKMNKSFAPGVHEINVYGSEKCCDGDFDARFSFNGAEYQRLSPENVVKQIDPQPINGIEQGKCAILYSECNYKGDHLEVCENDPDTGNFMTKSLYVPAGQDITLFNQVQFEGKRAKFEKSVECMEGPDFQSPAFLQTNQITLLSRHRDSKHRLRTNAKKN